MLTLIRKNTLTLITVLSAVSIAPLGNNTFFLNDFSGGLYLEWYDVYGISTQDQSPIVFTYDPCTGNISGEEGATEPLGSAVALTGTYNKCSGMLTYTWTNGFSDSGTIQLTPM